MKQASEKMREYRGKSENEIQNEVFDVLKDEGIFFWRSNNIPVCNTKGRGKWRYRKLPKHTPRGLPDIIAIYKGRLVAIEVKRKYEKLTPEQADIGLKIVSNGGEYLVVRSAEETREQLQKLKTSVQF
jgi:hypothetical protein